MIPHALKGWNQWVVWKYDFVGERKTKIPYTIGGCKASTIDPNTWCSYDSAQSFYDCGYADGIGFVFTKNDPFIGIDWDHCVKDGVIDQTVWEEVKSLGSYAEFSPSGTGIHVICTGDYRKTGKCRGNDREVYDNGRFFTMTGNHIEGTFDDVHEYLDGSLYHILEKINPRFDPVMPKTAAFKYTPVQSFSNESAREVFNKCASGVNKEKFKRLMGGIIVGYPSHSEADMALCNIIADYTDNPIIIDYIFRKSKLFRDKWDRIRSGVSYGSITINTAIHGKFMRSLRNIVEADDEN